MKYLTETDLAQAQRLSPLTITWLENEVELITDAMLLTNFGADPVQREIAVLGFVEMQAKRNQLLALLTDCSDAYAALAASST